MNLTPINFRDSRIRRSHILCSLLLVGYMTALGCSNQDSLGAIFQAIERDDAVAVESLCRSYPDCLGRLGESSKVSGRSHKMPPLHFACMRKRTRIVSLLLDCSADPNSRDQHQYSALHTAVTLGTPEFVRALLKAGAEIDARDGSKLTPLMSTYLQQDVAASIEMAKILLDAGADPTLTRDGYMTALDCAASAPGGGRQLYDFFKEQGLPVTLLGALGTRDPEEIMRVLDGPEPFSGFADPREILAATTVFAYSLLEYHGPSERTREIRQQVLAIYERLFELGVPPDGTNTVLPQISMLRDPELLEMMLKYGEDPLWTAVTSFVIPSADQRNQVVGEAERQHRSSGSSYVKHWVDELKTGDPMRCTRALKVLRRFGSRGKDAADSVRELLNHESESIRMEAEKTLTALESEVGGAGATRSDRDVD